MSDNANQNEQQPSDNQAGQASAINLKLLAEKVYRLMLADIRLAQVRGNQQGNRRKRSS
ncbi:MAG: hypothetical protein SH847_26875 [Roseiflexaceae bacterium]|nr:hypothetical protein [Roseiflexaceae bacterium]